MNAPTRSSRTAGSAGAPGRLHVEPRALDHFQPEVRSGHPYTNSHFSVNRRLFLHVADFRIEARM